MNPRITYIARSDATLESELDALACVYHFVLERHAASAAAAGSCRVQPEEGGGVDGSFTQGPDEDVGSSPMRNPKVGSAQVTRSHLINTAQVVQEAACI